MHRQEGTAKLATGETKGRNPRWTAGGARKVEEIRQGARGLLSGARQGYLTQLLAGTPSCWTKLCSSVSAEGTPTTSRTL